MTVEDFRILWFRDKAYLMKKPSIHRINNDKGYTKSNCKFIELSENSRLGALETQKRKSQKATETQ